MKLPQVLESKTSKNYKSKKLNTANFGDFNHTDYQVFLHLISKIGGVDEYGKYLQPKQLQREYSLTAKEFSEIFNVSLSNCYGILKRAVDKLMKTDIKIERTELKELWRINVCSTAKYNKTEGSILIEFTDRIMPYLAQVNEKFVLYNLKEIANFGSLYTTRLYELLQEFKETGWMLKSLEQLRKIFAVGKKFPAYKDFKKYTFAHACQEINDNYEMGLDFEELKEGRKVVAIKFVFKKTVAHKVVNQKTGKQSTLYIKPKAKLKLEKELGLKQLKFSNINVENLSNQTLPQESKLIKNILSSLFSKIKSFTK
jgi:plasmid replication initiation protein